MFGECLVLGRQVTSPLLTPEGERVARSRYRSTALPCFGRYGSKAADPIGLSVLMEAAPQR